MDFKYIVGQVVQIISKDRNLSDRKVKITQRHQFSWSTVKEPPTNWYKVSGEGIHSLSFFEDQLKEIS